MYLSHELQKCICIVDYIQFFVILQLSHLPLSFCHLKALRWLDLKKNPLVPMLEGIAGPCGDNKQCEQCARDIVRTFTKAAIKVEEDRNRMLQKKLLEKGR